jgi:alanyl-tRNA synthetase
VRVFWEDRENTAGLLLRKPPPAGLERLRLVEIPGHDLSACGGLHVSSTGAIGLVQLAGAERMRGRLRLSWRAGEPAYRAARHNERLLQELARGLSCGREELIAAMASLQTRAQSADQRAERLCRRLAPLLARELRQAAPRLGAAVAVVTRFDALDSGGGEPGAGEDGELTEAVFRQLLSAPGTVAVLVRREGERLRWLAGHSADLDLALLLPQLPSIEGKGGGRGALWQGVGSKVEGVEAFLAAVNDALRQALGAPGAETQRHGNLA